MIPKSTAAQVSYKMVHLHITYAHPLLDVKSSLRYLMHHKCYVSRCQCTTDSSFAFWNFLIIFSNIFYSWLVESVSAEPVDTKEYMCPVPSRVQLFAALQTGAHQAPLSMGFSRQEDWSGLPCPPPGDLPDPGIEPRSPALLHCRWILYHCTTWEAQGGGQAVTKKVRKIQGGILILSSPSGSFQLLSVCGFTSFLVPATSAF